MSFAHSFYIPRRGKGRRPFIMGFFKSLGVKGMGKLTIKQLLGAYIDRRKRDVRIKDC